ncbi:uncharacterized protein LOC125704702 [Brienomyrus brachyistius]|uniref:uncharacterized protein LOC125704702 n=1 Tax=Brienomyrus brachyistius TaxID=42636 RepID=UPI0020B229CA|nr:uncharacterized protein LOC125704702 [Brienomyrus brachyistius]
MQGSSMYAKRPRKSSRADGRVALFLSCTLPSPSFLVLISGLSCFLHISRSARSSRVTMVKLTIIAVLLFVVCNESLPTQPTTPTITTRNATEPTTCLACSTPVTVPSPSPTAPPPPVLAFITVSAKASSCHGALHVVFNLSDVAPLCYQSYEKLTSLRNVFCANLGCDRFEGWKQSQNSRGYEIVENGIRPRNNCMTLELVCKAPPKSKELIGYKTVTGLLITAILVLLFHRFGHKRCTTLHNKLFKRRNREWIGPTQSQSVSFHRAQAGKPPSSSSARYSYPALERLSVQPSREPSSNRNSDCDSYN